MSAEKTSKDSDQTTGRATRHAKEQSDGSSLEPARAYGSLTTDYYEQLFSTQFDAVRAIADKSLSQSRSWLGVKDAESFQKVVEEQQQTIRELSDRLKEDTQKISSLSQAFMKESQQLAAESMQVGRKQLEENMQQGKEQAKDSMQKSRDEATGTQQTGTQQKGQQQSEKGNKAASTTTK